MREILTDIFTWPWFSEPHGYNFNGHFIRYAGRNLCVDPVEPSEEDLAELARQGVARILITNRNHSRAANKIRARTGARTAIHPADAPHARKEGAELDDELNPGDKAGPFVVIDSPGKSLGEVVLHWPERRILLVGDAVVGDPPGRCKLLPDKVVDDPGRMPSAVEEILRYWAPSQYQGRFTTKPATIHGVTIPAGAPTLLLTGAASRDERAYPEPDRFDIDRKQQIALGFGYGIHSCLGIALARLESRIAFEELCARYPRYRVDERGLRRVQMANVAGYSHVPVSLPARPSS